MVDKRIFCLFLVLAVNIAYGLYEGKSDCELPRYRGPCDGRYHSYYFDIKSRECKPFIWSGCGGNGNRFYSLDECQFACSYFMKLD